MGIDGVSGKGETGLLLPLLVLADEVIWLREATSSTPQAAGSSSFRLPVPIKMKCLN